MAKEHKRVDLMDESRNPFLTILLLAWPVFVEQIFTTLVSYADTAMVGSLGAEATAAITISNSPIMLLNGIVMSLGVGITSLVARAVGAQNPDLVKKLIKHAVLAILYLGVPIWLVNIGLHRLIPKWMGAAPEILDTAANYNLVTSLGRIFMIASMMLNSAFRGYGDTKTPLKVNTLMNVVNVILNFLLIYPTRQISFLGLEFTMWGAGLEVIGAGIATSVGMATAGCINLYIAFFRKNEYALDLKSSWKLDPTVTKQVLRISFPAMLERLFMSSSGIFTTSTIATLGTVNVAANSLTLTAESISFMPAFAFQTAITTLVGQSLGAKKPHLAEKFVGRTMLISCSLMVVANVLLFIFAEPLISIFTPDADVIELGAQCLRVVAFMQVPQVVGWNFAGVLRGAGDTKYNFYVSAGTNWLIRTLFTILAIRVWGMGLVAAQYIIMVEILVRMGLLIARYKTGKWKTIMS